MNALSLLRAACLLLAALLLVLSVPAGAQDADISGPIATGADAVADVDIATRLAGIYAEIPALSDIAVTVRGGVVLLDGEVAGEPAADRAVAIAARVNGVVTVEDRLARTLALETNVSPFVADARAVFEGLARSWPVYLIVIGVFVLILLLGHGLASWTALWNRLAPNPFLAHMLSQAVRIVALVLAVLVALALLGATALLGALAGAVGIIGLALGFAVRDTIENYIASILLSLRQPFRGGDHVVINEHEGVVVRLTSRATVLMTLDGNHLRLPNADVFKGVILNYTRNPERRFEFELGVDAEDDPVAAMDSGLNAIGGLPFVLAGPAPDAAIVEVGDSSIVLRFNAWIDQTQSDFLKARSLAIRAAKTALEEDGFTLPEPIYRLRFDPQIAAALPLGEAPSPSAPADTTERAPSPPADPPETADVAPDRHIERKVAEERAERGTQDLLDDASPVE